MISSIINANKESELMNNLVDLQYQLEKEREAQLLLEKKLLNTQKKLEISEANNAIILKNKNEKKNLQEERFQNIIDLSSEAVWELDILLYSVRS